MKKTLRILLLILGIFGLVGGIVTLPLEAQAQSRAKRYQIVRKSAEASLFGDVGEPIGSPQEYIVDDPSVVLPETGDGGILLLDDIAMKQKGVYPVQLQTVRFVLGTARAVGLGVGVVAMIAWWLLGRSGRVERSKTPAQGRS